MRDFGFRIMTKRIKAPRKRRLRRDIGSEIIQAVRDIKAGRGRRYVVRTERKVDGGR